MKNYFIGLIGSYVALSGDGMAGVDWVWVASAAFTIISINFLYRCIYAIFFKD